MVIADRERAGGVPPHYRALRGGPSRLALDRGTDAGECRLSDAGNKGAGATAPSGVRSRRPRMAWRRASPWPRVQGELTMRDAAQRAVVTARLNRRMDERECRQRN